VDIFRLAEKGPPMAGKRTRPYPADFRQKTVELARSGRGKHDLAAEFKLAGQTIRKLDQAGRFEHRAPQRRLDDARA